MNILDLCDEHPASVHPYSTVAEAIRAMVAHRVGAVAVVDADAKVVGIFTERDLMKRQALSGRDPQTTPVSEFMTAPVETITSRTNLGDAFAKMMNSHFRHLPIVDASGKLLGILSLRNLLQAQVEELKQQLNSMEQYVTNDALGG
jgi:CBS domain-containing protein